MDVNVGLLGGGGDETDLVNRESPTSYMENIVQEALSAAKLARSGQIELEILRNDHNPDDVESDHEASDLEAEDDDSSSESEWDQEDEFLGESVDKELLEMGKPFPRASKLILNIGILTCGK